MPKNINATNIDNRSRALPGELTGVSLRHLERKGGRERQRKEPQGHREGLVLPPPSGPRG